MNMTGVRGWRALLVGAIVSGATALTACGSGIFHVPATQDRTPIPGVPTVNPEQTVEGGDAARGKQLMHRYACATCHVIPGVAGANGQVGPPLTSWAQRAYIAGNLSNTPENLIRWVQVPQSVEPGTAMPNLGVTDQDARDIASYLYTLR